MSDATAPARTFVGLGGFPHAVMAALIDVQSALQDAFPDVPMRLTDPSNLHITLRFLGFLDPFTQANVADDLAHLTAPSFMLSLSELGVFHVGDDITYLWAGVHHSTELLMLEHAVNETLGTRFARGGEGAFTPHITLARIKGAPADFFTPFINQFGALDTVDFDVDDVKLYETQHDTAGRKHYVPKALFPLY